MLCARFFFLMAMLNTVGSVLASGKNESFKLQYRVVAQDSLASAMMLGLANEDTAFIFDKVENNKKKTASGRITMILVLFAIALAFLLGFM